MIVAIADTHTAIWYLFSDARLGAEASAFIDKAAATGDQVGVSAISLAEMVYLIERGRIPIRAVAELCAAIADPNAVLQHVPVDENVVLKMIEIPREQIITQERSPGATMRRSDSHKITYPVDAAEPLQIIARYQSAHAEGHEVDRLVLREGCADIAVQLSRKLIESRRAIIRYEIGGGNGESVTLQMRLHSIEQRGGIVDSMDEQHRIAGHSLLMLPVHL